MQDRKQAANRESGAGRPLILALSWGLILGVLVGAWRRGAPVISSAQTPSSEPQPVPVLPSLSATRPPDASGFSSALAEIVATILSVLVAAGVAYFVFAEERKAEIDDRVLTTKFAIRDELWRLLMQWPSSSSMYAPTGFLEEFQTEYPNLTRGNLLYRASADLIFQSPQLATSLSRLDKEPFGDRSMRGRLFLNISSNVVWLLTDSMVGRGGEDPREVFPNVATAPGFEEWRHDFRFASASLRLLAPYRQVFINDLTDMSKVHWEPPERLFDRIRTNDKDLFAAIERIQVLVDNVDRQLERLTPYARPSPSDVPLLGILIAVSFLLGVVLPLARSARRRFDYVVLVLALGSTVLATAFAIVTVVRRPDGPSYDCEQWIRPLRAEVSDFESEIENGQIPSVWRFNEVVNRGALSEQLRLRIQRTLALEHEYELKLEPVLVDLSARIHADQTLQSLAALPQPKKNGFSSQSVQSAVIWNEDFSSMMGPQIAASTVTER